MEILPLDQIRPGMTGIGRTVFEGIRIDEFQVRILGVLENALGPKHSVILARLEGGPLAKTGVIAGMSGSPVFIDGKLVGAVAYAFPFGKEPIAGITPIGDMIEATRVETPRAASARFRPQPRPRAGRTPRPRGGRRGLPAPAPGHHPRPAPRRVRAGLAGRGHPDPARPAPRLLRFRPEYLRLGPRHLLRPRLRAHDRARPRRAPEPLSRLRRSRPGPRSGSR